MANKNSGKHIALTVGANTGLSIGQMREDLKSITKTLNRNPPKISVAINPASLTSIQQQIQKAINKGVYTISLNTNPSAGGGGNGQADYLKGKLYKISREYSSTPWMDDSYTSKMQKSSAVYSEYTNRVNEVRNALLGLNAIDNNGNILDISNINYANNVTEIEKLIDLYTELKIAKKAATDVNFSEKEVFNLNKIKSGAYDYYNRNSVGISRNAGLNKQFQDLLSNDTIDSNTFKRKFIELQAQVRKLGLEAESTGQKIKSAFGERIKQEALSAAFMALSLVIRRVYQNTVELDKALTNLQIATGKSKEATRSLLKDYSVLGQQLGATTLEVSEAADAWLRQGYSTKDANLLIQNSMMLSKLGQIESAQATTALTSAMKGYNLTVEDTTAIVDKLTAVDMEAAVSAGDLAIAMAETNTGARIAGVDMDRLIGYISTVAEVTQDGAESVGTFYKTLFARMGNIKAGELIDPETSEDLSNVENVLKGVGIHLRENGGEFRNFGEVLDEVNSKWGDYGTVQQRAIAVAFAGTRQQEKFLTLMEHYGEAMEYAEISTESAGTALQKYETSYLTSAEAAQNRMNASFEEFSQTILSSATLIDAFDFLSDIAGDATELTHNVGGLKGAIAGLVAIMTMLNLKKLGNEVNAVITSFKSGSSVIGAFSAALDAPNHKIRTFINGLTGLQGAASAATIGIAALTAAISIGIIFYQKAKQKQEELRQAAAESAEAYEDNASTIEEYKTKIRELRDELDSNNLSEAEAYSRREELISIQSDLIDRFGDEAKAIDIVTGSINEQIKAIDELTSKNWNDWYTSNHDAREDAVTAITDPTNFSNGMKASATGRIVFDNNRNNEELFKRLEEELGMTAESVAGSGKIAFNFSKDDTDNIYSLIDAYSELYIIVEDYKRELEESGENTTYYDNLLDRISENKSALEALENKSEQTFNTYAEGVLKGYHSNEIYAQSWRDLTSAEKAYSDAVSRANKDGVITDEESEDLKIKLDNLKTAKAEIEELIGADGGDPAVDVYLIQYLSNLQEQIDGIEATNLKKEVDDIAESAYNLQQSSKGKDVDLEPIVGNIEEYADKIRDAYGESEIFTDVQEGMTDEELVQWFIEYIGVIAKFKDKTEEAESAVSSFSDTISTLKKTGETIEPLGKAYKELYEDGKIAFDTLAEIQENFSDVEGIEEYIKALAAADGNTAKTAQAFDALLESAVMSKLGVENLADANVDLVASMLNTAGVSNSTAKAEELITKARIKDKYATLGSAEAVATSIENLEAEAKQSGLTKNAMIDLVSSCITFNNTNLDVSQKIAALQSLAIQAGLTNSLMYGGLYESYLKDAENSGKYRTGEEVEAAALAALRNKLMSDLGYDPNSTTTWTPPEGTGKDANLEAWEESVAQQKHLLETDQITKEEYYDWLRGAYKKSLSDTKKYAKEIRGIEKELYEWEKERIEENVALKDAQLKNQMLNGEIEEADYQRAMVNAYADAYEEIEKNADLYGVDEKERLESLNGYLEKEKSAYNALYDEEREMLDHKLAMNLISEEQYLIELERLYEKYYKGNDKYKEESLEVEEEIYDKRVELIEKWSDAAIEAVEAVAEATEETVSAITDFIEGMVDAHMESYNLEKRVLDHYLAMGYISEEEHLDALRKLNDKYFKDKNLYLDEYLDSREEVYNKEQQILEDTAGAIEDIHGKIVDMIKSELEDAIDSIEKTKEKYLELIDVRREALNDKKDEDDYHEQRDEKLNNIADLERQLDALSRDTSAAGIKMYKEIYAKLKDAEKDLADFDEDHSFDVMNNQLDNEEITVESQFDTQINGLEKALNDCEYLVDEAWKRMANMNEELFTQLTDYTAKHSTSIKDDLTESWNTVSEAVGKYGTTLKDAYGIIVGDPTDPSKPGLIGAPGMDSSDANELEATVVAKQVGIYGEPVVTLVGDIATTLTGMAADLAGILDSVFDTPLTGIIAGAAGAMDSVTSVFASIASSLFGLTGLATGSTYVPKTGVYRTDELGEELKLFKNKAGGNYTLLTKGSKVFTNEQTERLMRIINNPGLLHGVSYNIELSKMNDAYKSLPVPSNQTVTMTNVFEIHSSDPQGVAAEIEKLLPEIAHYTIGNMVNNINNNGIRRKVQHSY